MKLFVEHILDNVTGLGDRRAVVSRRRGVSLSYLDLGIQMGGIQRILGDVRGKKVAVVMENRPEWISALFAVLLGGGIAIPVDCELTAFELSAICRDCSPDIAVVSSYTAEKVSSAFSGCGIVNVEECDIPDELPRFFRRDPGEIALILYTSGTTGNPKGVCLSFSNLDHNVKAIESLGFLKPDDRFVAFLPFHHAYPLMATVIVPLSFGLEIILVERLTAEDIFSTAREEGATILVGVPKFYRLLHRAILGEIRKLPLHRRFPVLLALRFFRILKLKGLSRIVFSRVHRRIGENLRFMISGGAKLHEDTWKDLEAMGFEILEGYGLTETSPIVSVNVPSAKKIGSAGKPLEGVEVKVAEDGEILVKGPNVMTGYYRREEETACVIKDGWFCTGDLGFVDRKGFLHITGRKKEMIVLETGKNVYPEEVEEEILKSPYIVEVGVFYHDGRIKALVRPDFELLARKGVGDVEAFIAQEIKRAMEHLQPYKRVREFKIVGFELPKTRIGKLRRFLLPKLWEEVEP